MDRQGGDAQVATGGVFVAGEVRFQARRELGRGGGAGGVAAAVAFLVRVLGEVVEFVGEVAVGAGEALDELVAVGADHARVAVFADLGIAPFASGRGGGPGRLAQERQAGSPGTAPCTCQLGAITSGGVGERHEQVAVVDRLRMDRRGADAAGCCATLEDQLASQSRYPDNPGQNPG